MLDHILDLFRRDYADPGTLLSEEDFDDLALPPRVEPKKLGIAARSQKSVAACLDGLRGERERCLARILDRKVQIVELEAELAEIDQSIAAFQSAAEKLKPAPPANVTPLRKGKAKEAAE